jgi:hypothetical protein
MDEDQRHADAADTEEGHGCPAPAVLCWHLRPLPVTLGQTQQCSGRDEIAGLHQFLPCKQVNVSAHFGGLGTATDLARLNHAADLDYPVLRSVSGGAAEAGL